MSINFGGGDQKQTESRQIAAPSAAEQQLQAMNLQIAQQQAAQLAAANAQQQAYASSPQAQMDRELQQRSTQALLDRLNGTAPVLNPQQQAMLDQSYNATGQQGMEDLTRFAGEQAAQRGMTTADSPIGAEALRQARLFQRDLQSAKAKSALDLSQTGANFNQSLAQFGSGLQQQALANRLALSTSTPGSYGLQQNLFGQRLAAAPRSMSGNMSSNQYGGNLGQLGQFAGGVGGLLSAYGAYQGGQTPAVPTQPGGTWFS